MATSLSSYSFKTLMKVKLLQGNEAQKSKLESAGRTDLGLQSSH